MAIDLGSIVFSGNKRVGSGIVSGLDSASIVDSLVEARRTPAVKLEDTVEVNATKVTKFNELRTLLDNLNSAVNFLRNPQGLNASSQNVFKYRTTTLVSNTSTSAESFFSASASAGATKGSFDFAVGQLAKARTLRTDAFTSNSASVVSSTPAAGEYKAGSFDIAPTIATAVDSTIDLEETLATADYTVIGTGGSDVLDGAGMTITVTGDGDTGLIGDLTLASNPIGGNYSPTTDELTLSFTVRGKTYTSNAITTNAGVSGEAIADGTVITFTNAETGTEIAVTTSGDYEIGDDGDAQAQLDNVNAFVSSLQSDISSQTILQERNITSFDSTQVREPLTGLTSSHIVFTTDDYNSTASLGDISGFTITHNGVDDNDISVEIDGETYTVTGLDDSLNSNITLTGSGNKTLTLNLADAGVTLDLSSQNDADDAAAAFDYAFGTRELQTITLNAGDSLVNVAASINTLSASTGVTASIIQVSSTDFRLQLKSNTEGEDNSFAIVDDEGVWDNITYSETQAAQDAIFAVDGIVTTRGTNTVTDVITGLTLNLTKVTNSFTTQGGYNGLGSPQLVTVNVTDDKATAKTGILNFIDAYNAYRVFVAEQTTRDEDGKLLEDAVLGTDTTLNVLISQLGVEVVGSVAGVSNSQYAALANIGINVTDYEGDSETIATRGILQYDETTLDAALASNYENIREIFEARFTASSSDLSLFSTTNDLELTDFKVEVVNATTVNIRNINTNAIMFQMDRSGTMLTGRDGTALEGVKFIYSGSGAETITVHLTQGVADRFYNILNPFLEDDGTLDSAIGNINDNSERLQDEIGRIDEQINSYRDRLLAQYAALEEAVAKINNLLDLLDANNQAMFGSKN